MTVKVREVKEPQVAGMTDDKGTPIPGSNGAGGRGRKSNSGDAEERKANVTSKSEDGSER